jgi:class 3 adenylate cyclase
VVPEPADLKLGNEAVEFERATVLYADLAGSTALVDGRTWQFAAEIYKTYLHCAAAIIRAEGGAIRSYDGDRVMGIWTGEIQSTPAARCGLKINYAVSQIINPALCKQYGDAGFVVKQVVGIDTSPIRAARTGVRGQNDIVWVGRAANHAAKLTDLKTQGPATWVTKDAYTKMMDNAKYSRVEKKLMWSEYTWHANGDATIYGSDWWWAPDY